MMKLMVATTTQSFTSGWTNEKGEFPDLFVEHDGALDNALAQSTHACAIDDNVGGKGVVQ